MGVCVSMSDCGLQISGSSVNQRSSLCIGQNHLDLSQRINSPKYSSILLLSQV